MLWTLHPFLQAILVDQRCTSDVAELSSGAQAGKMKSPEINRRH
jgi:hypothetical protein